MTTPRLPHLFSAVRSWCAVGSAAVILAGCVGSADEPTPPASTSATSPTSPSVTSPGVTSPGVTVTPPQPSPASAAATTGSASSTTVSTTSMIDPHGLGPLRLRMTTPQARAAAGSLLTYRAADGGYCDFLGGDGIDVLLPTTPAPARVVMIRVGSVGAATGIATKEGIRIGSPVAEVRRAYPNAVRVDHAVNQGVGQYYEVDEGADALAISIADGTVISLTAATRDALRAEELCA